MRSYVAFALILASCASHDPVHDCIEDVAEENYATCQERVAACVYVGRQQHGDDKIQALAECELLSDKCNRFLLDDMLECEELGE